MGFFDTASELATDLVGWVKSFFESGEKAEEGHRNFGICDPEKGAEQCPFAATKDKFWVEVTVATRLGGYPLRGVTISVNGAAMGRTDAGGGFAEGREGPMRHPIGNEPFFITAVYQSAADRLKAENIRVMFLDVDIPSGRLNGKVSWKITKPQEAAGTGDESLDEKIGLESSDVKVATRREVIGWVVSVTIPVATYSLVVPYVNQNIGDEYLTTVPGKDPEASVASFGPFKGYDLCFPTCLTMILNYWGVSATRNKVLQKSYELYASDNFNASGYKRASVGAVKSITEPPAPAIGSYWLDTSDASKAKLKKLTSSATSDDGTTANVWTTLADSKWRVQAQGQACCWQYHDRARKLLNSMAPEGGSSPGIESWEEERNPVSYRADLGDPNGALPHYASLLSQGWPFSVGTNATGSGHIMLVRGVVVDSKQNIRFVIANDPYGNLVTLGSIVEAPTLGGSVGIGGANAREDVENIQEILQAKGLFAKQVDGICDGEDPNDPTVIAIIKYQKQFKTVPVGQPKGTITPGDKTTVKMGEQAQGGYEKGEINDSHGDTGRHVYYTSSTLASGGKQLRFSGKWRGCCRIEKSLDAGGIAKRLVSGA